jgi:hypothetical protein
MMYSFRLYRKTQDREFLLGVNNSDNNKLISTINSILKRRSCIDELVPLDEKCKIAFRNYNALKYFLFGLCNFTLDDIEKLDMLGFRIQKLNLGVFSSGLSNMYVSYYTDEVDECEDMSLIDIFVSDKDITFKSVKQQYVSDDNLKYYKSRYGKFLSKLTKI